MESDEAGRLRALPSVDAVLNRLGDSSPHPVAVAAARLAVEDARRIVRDGKEAPSEDDIAALARGHIRQFRRSLLRPVINATGVLIHTNLGRVPLGSDQLEAVNRISSGYSNLEYELELGRRGSRYSRATRLITTLTGAESALVVNNNAAAVLLVLTALCAQREVIISRGELIEIGGEFRMPDVMATSGATLVDVGTTNRTHLSDYERALSDNTAAILKVHPSNYRVVGFTSSVTGSELAHLAHERNTLFLHDLGSGLIQAPPEAEWAGAEPTLEMALSDGADLVTFSGDKLLGGPQAGLIVGRADLIRRCSQHPLARALRVDKMTLAALEKTIELLLDNRARDLPLWRMALAPAAEIETRARAVAERVKSHLSQSDVKVEVVPTRAVTGGGSLPETSVSSWSILLSHGETSSDELARALRSDDPAVIGRIEEDRVLLDLRTVPAEDDDVLTAAIRRALGS